MEGHRQPADVIFEAHMEDGAVLRQGLCAECALHRLRCGVEYSADLLGLGCDYLVIQRRQAGN